MTTRDPHTLYTWVAQEGHVPIRLAGGEGAWFRDAGGRRYLDFASVALNANAGHNHPMILAAMRRQLDDLCVAGPSMSTGIRERAAAALARVTPPGLDRFLFTLGGGDAVEHAVKMARLATGRRKVVCRTNSYHGATLGALSFSDDPRCEPFGAGGPDVIRVKDPWCFHCPWGTAPDVCDRPCITHVEEAVEREGAETVAAILMETIPGTQAGYIPPPDYYRRLRGLCDRHGILLILDEVLTGFGRTGRWFGIDHYDARPDMMALGKGITSGHAPLGAVAVGRRIARVFDRKVLMTGTTHSAHPIGLAAALGNLAVMEEEGLVDRARRLGQRLATRLERIKECTGVVADARCLGLYGSLELAEPFDPARVRREALAHGLYLLSRGRCLYAAPPLVIEEADLDKGLDCIEEVLLGSKAHASSSPGNNRCS